MSFEQLCRYTIGLMWIYQGIAPKLLHVAPLEMEISASLGFSTELTLMFIRAAGIAEILFGMIFIAHYKNKSILQLNMLALIGLLVITAIQTPHILIEAFNPVTTNIPVILLSYYLYKSAKNGKNV